MLNSFGIVENALSAAFDSTSGTSKAVPVLLALAGIEHGLRSAGAFDCLVEAVAVTGSTNDDLAARARAQQPDHCTLRAADYQTGGRGRQMRAWRASPGDALLFSVAVPIAGVPAAISAITLACGVALAESLAEHGIHVRLKWPNDVRIDGEKLAGILSELVSDAEGRHTLIIGIGVNWRLGDVVHASIGQPAIALYPMLDQPRRQTREPWIGLIGGRVLAAITRFMCDGFDPFRARFNQLLETRGEVVDIVDGQRTTTGRIIEVDQIGRLVVECRGERMAVSVGEVSIRPVKR